MGMEVEDEMIIEDLDLKHSIRWKVFGGTPEEMRL
jgi:hypothetical protein